MGVDRDAVSPKNNKRNNTIELDLWIPRSLILLVTDVLVVIFAGLASFALRFEFKIPHNYLILYTNNLIVIVGIMVGVFYLLNLYKSLWRYASISELISVVLACVIGDIVILLVNIAREIIFPRSFYILFFLLTVIFVGGTRFIYRILRRAKNMLLASRSDSSKVLVIGAGKAGSMVIKEMLNSPDINRKPIGIIDDDKSKHHRKIQNVPILGTRYDIGNIAKQHSIDEILVAIPSLPRKEMRGILELCKNTDAKLKTLPGMYELINGQVDVTNARDVNVEDLLGREQIKMDVAGVKKYIEDSTVLVTGGGGSIGSELCRQIVKYNPSKLIILDIYENNAYDIQNELKRNYGDIDLKVLIASVRDIKRLDYIFRSYRPSIVFHAAAHKHVPLMEDSPSEAIKNNVFGTLNMAELASKYNVERFILISTDKAVNPTNIMGATKRIAEMIVQTLNQNSKTEFMAVRFGNVLGSNGSVIPLFKKQIDEGGPVTVTHPEVIRYFMTIPEAVQLILQAGCIAEGGEIFVLDMGEQVKIVDLAEDLIKLSGLRPNEDIDIEFVGLRPGEKLYEELLMAEEGLTNTKHEKIFIGKPIDIDEKRLANTLDKLRLCIANDDYIDVLDIVKGIVPGYRFVS